MKSLAFLYGDTNYSIILEILKWFAMNFIALRNRIRPPCFTESNNEGGNWNEREMTA